MGEGALGTWVLIMYDYGAFIWQPLVSNFHLSFEFSHLSDLQFNAYFSKDAHALI